MLDISVPPTRTEDAGSVNCTIEFRKPSLFDSITADGKRIAIAFDRSDCRFTCTIKAIYRGCQRVRLDVSTRIKGFVGPSEEFEGTTTDDFEMVGGPTIRIGTITPDAVEIVLVPAVRT